MVHACTYGDEERSRLVQMVARRPWGTLWAEPTRISTVFYTKTGTFRCYGIYSSKDWEGLREACLGDFYSPPGSGHLLWLVVHPCGVWLGWSAHELFPRDAALQIGLTSVAFGIVTLLIVLKWYRRAVACAWAWYGLWTAPIFFVARFLEGVFLGEEANPGPPVRDTVPSSAAPTLQEVLPEKATLGAAPVTGLVEDKIQQTL